MKYMKQLKKFTNSDVVLVDPARMNYALYNNIPEDVKKSRKTKSICSIQSYEKPN